MKKYLFFACARYEPSGGWADFVASFDSIEEITLEKLMIISEFIILDKHFYHIVDRDLEKEVESGEILNLKKT